MATKQTQRTPSIAAKKSTARKPAATKPNGPVAVRKRAARSPVLGSAGSAVKQGIAVSIKGVARGAVAGVHDVQGNVAKAAAEIVKTAMRQAHRVGADVAVVARRAVDGIVEGVKETGGNVAESTKGAVKGAVQVGAEIGKLAADAVRQVVAGVAEGMGEIAKTRSTTPRPVVRTAARKRAAATRRPSA